MNYPNIGPDQQLVVTYVPKCLQKRLKVIAAMKNTSMRQILIGLIQEYVAAQIKEVKMLVADDPTYSVAKSVKRKNGNNHRVKTAKLGLRSRVPTSKKVLKKPDKIPDGVLSNKGGLSGHCIRDSESLVPRVRTVKRPSLHQKRSECRESVKMAKGNPRKEKGRSKDEG